ncbi:Hsp20/alpha crystallin family protein [Mycobacterium sp.]|uniref:Hsp20/alpha crystallin family protein n=1 Tax=Mycobacterium sp. TaxID=1785 RepID=UPI002D2460A5|nr:Hsp20/alpha crystallin family protein [Mycobacterium sp.]HZA10235.1 Hsp20/alpha crystallin family protein [Mycobacterium sp.]
MGILPYQDKFETVLSRLVVMLSDLPGFAALRHALEKSAMPLEHDMKDDRYEVRAEIPGIDPSGDADISIEEGWLTIAAERSQKSEGGGRSEFRYGSFVRSVPLPDGADTEGVITTYDMGILTVSVPLAEADAEPAEEEAEPGEEAEPEASEEGDEEGHEVGDEEGDEEGDAEESAERGEEAESAEGTGLVTQSAD